MGLRTRNKRLKREAMIQAARELFEARGFDSTQMEEIAASAGVSTATAYNYFESKTNVLASIALLHLRSALPARRALLRKLPADPVKGAAAFERLLAKQALATMGENGWRVIFRAGYDMPPTKLSRLGKLMSRKITQHYLKMLRAYRDQGSLVPDTDVELAAELLTTVGMARFARFVMDDEMSAKERLAVIPRQVSVILSPWLPATRPARSPRAADRPPPPARRRAAGARP